MMFRSSTAPWPQYWPSYPWDEYTAPQPWTQINMNWWITCPQCAKLVRVGSVYCPTCGAKMIPEVTEKDKLDLILEKLDEILEEVKKNESRQ